MISNATAPTDDMPPGPRLLGARLRALRLQRNLTLKQVASACGIAPSFLSLVERGETDLSLSRFSRLAEHYDVAPSELMLALGSRIAEPEILPRARFRSIERGAGVEFRILQDENPQLSFARLEPGARFDELRAHAGHDYWYVASGNVQLLRGRRVYELHEGDTARFSATVPHGLANPYEAPAVLIALGTVPLW
jgi:transcriptional regulator with XRE-family HTH domain